MIDLINYIAGINRYCNSEAMFMKLHYYYGVVKKG